MNKTYYNTRSKETTEAATIAMKWHNNGDVIEVWEKNHTVRINGAEVETEQEKFNRVEGRERCERIARELDAYADGFIHKCPDCNEVLEFPENVGDKFRCPHCETVSDVDEWEELTIYDYMEDILDIDFTVNRFKEYRSCNICIGWGGPNIYIDTADAYVKLYWGSTREKFPIKYSTNDAIDEWAEEYYNYI